MCSSSRVGTDSISAIGSCLMAEHTPSEPETEMNYLRVRWIHDFPGEPTDIYSEVDAEAREVRKVEVFADGAMQFAGLGRETGDTWLGDQPIPDLQEIASSPEFVPEAIDRDEFERIWDLANHPAGSLA